MENFLEESPHPASSHVLPEGEDKEPTGGFSPKRSNFQMNNALRTIAQWQIVASAKRSENPLARFGRGGTTQVVGEGLD